jgi:hypothetical protein
VAQASGKSPSAPPAPAQAQGSPKPRPASARLGPPRPASAHLGQLLLLPAGHTGPGFDMVDDVKPGEEEPVLGGARVDVDHVREEVGSAVPALEGLRDDRVMRAQVRAAREAYVHTWRLCREQARRGRQTRPDRLLGRGWPEQRSTEAWPGAERSLRSASWPKAVPPRL